MRWFSFLIFFTIVLSVYGLGNYYIFIRGWQSIPGNSGLRPYYLIAFLFIAASFIAGRVLERFWLSPLSAVLVWMGSFWLAAMLYFFLIVVLLDLLRLVNHLTRFFPLFVMRDYSRTKEITALVSLSIVAVLLVAGHVNALSPRVRTLDLNIPKRVSGQKTVNIVAVSDIHLGGIVGRRRLQQLVSKIEELKPDLILLPGDIVDEDLRAVIKHNVGDALKNLKAPLGVVAITGNHEYIGGVEKACKYLTERNVLMLRDSVMKVGDSFYLVGREDREIKGFTGRNRKPLEELMAQVDKSCPVILLDHQPFHLEEGVANGADIQLSGHTHHGQLWPLTYITDAIYEVSAGYRRKGGTHVYVSTGYGTWGPPVRTGNRPEIVNIRLNFE